MRVVRDAHRAQAQQARRRRAASVNYATEQATVVYDPAQVERRTTSSAPSRPRATGAAFDGEAAREGTSARAPRLVVAAALTVAARRCSRWSPPLQFDGWEWVALALATPVVLWAGFGLPPRGRSQRAPRRGDDGHAHLDRHARRLGLVDRRARPPGRHRGRHVLRGRRPSSRRSSCSAATSRRARGAASGAAIRALLELGAKEARVLRDGEEVLVPIDELRVGDLFVVRPGREDRDRRRRRRGRVGGRPVDADRRAGAGRGRPGRGRRRRDDQHVRPARRARDAASAPRRRSRRSRASSPRRRPARRRSSGSPTASRPSSCRS